MSAADFNNDGQEDLFLFDRQGDVPVLLLKNETSASSISANYTYSPAYLSNFPKVQTWCLLHDFNQDGIADMFAGSPDLGPQYGVVYQGHYVNDSLRFQRLFLSPYGFDYIYFPSGDWYSYIYFNEEDIPSFQDIDNDGDTDLLAFAYGGNFVEYYENQSVEMGYGADSIILERSVLCWGGIFETGTSLQVSQSEVAGECANEFWAGGEEPIEKTGAKANAMHGTSTLYAYDADEDGDKDLLYGSILFEGLSLCYNGGDTELAHITAQDTLYPTVSAPCMINYQPGPHFQDMDADGDQDLLISPLASNGENYATLQLYERTEAGYNFVQDDLFTDRFVDLGSHSAPAYFDHNFDGLLDIVVGTRGYFQETGLYDPRLQLFENVGTSTEPAFTLVDDDWLGFSAFAEESWTFVPTFGDLDGDGDQDLLIGDVHGTLFYVENTSAESSSTASFGTPIYGYAGIDVSTSLGQSACPQLIDVDRDGLLDLLIGESDGNVNFFKNTGTVTTAEFDPDPMAAVNNHYFGEVDTRVAGFFKGYSAPALLDIDGEYHLVVGTYDGGIRYYTNIDDNLEGAFNYELNAFSLVRQGHSLRPCIADLNNDGLQDMLVGNARGGLSLYSINFETLTSVNENPQTEEALLNLVVEYADQKQLNLSWECGQNQLQQASLRLFNIQGQAVHQHSITSLAGEHSIHTHDLPTGIYIARLEMNGQFITKKIILF